MRKRKAQKAGFLKSFFATRLDCAVNWHVAFAKFDNSAFCHVLMHCLGLRPWQTRAHCCGQIVANTNVSLFARARNICCGHKFCVRDTKKISYFVQKHFVSTTNVSQFAQPKKYHVLVCQGL